MNHLTINGYLGNDPEVHSTQGGTTVVSARIANTVRRGDRTITTWLKVLAFRTAGDILSEARKGDGIVVDGRLEVEINQEKTKAGQPKKNGKTYTNVTVVANEIYRLAKRAAADEDTAGEPPSEEDDDIPF